MFLNVDDNLPTFQNDSVLCLSPSRIILAFGILLLILVLALLFSCVLWMKARGRVRPRPPGHPKYRQGTTRSWRGRFFCSLFFYRMINAICIIFYQILSLKFRSFFSIDSGRDVLIGLIQNELFL